MPKIRLKPNSPEFHDGSKPKSHVQKCDMPGCDLEAPHRAPKDRGLNNYYHFCLEHVRDYNKAWNYFEGFSADDMEDAIRKSAMWDRPTQKFGGSFRDLEDDLRRYAWKMKNFTNRNPSEEELYGNQKHNRHSTYGLDTESQEYKALQVMGLEPPLDLESLKKRYRALVKETHPDLDTTDKMRAERMKEINNAYTILKLACARYEEILSKQNDF